MMACRYWSRAATPMSVTCRAVFGTDPDLPGNKARINDQGRAACRRCQGIRPGQRGCVALGMTKRSRFKDVKTRPRVFQLAAMVSF